MAARSFVGFGFGPIQSGLFLYEAFAGGNFERFTVAEVDAALVQAVRANGGAYAINVAEPDGVRTVVVPGVRMLNPRVPADREQLLGAIAQADELATALPSVRFYDGDDASVVALLAGAIDAAPMRPRILYAAENDNRAAEILTGALERRLAPDRLVRFQALNTVIGKMSGVVDDAELIARLGLATIVPGSGRAILVERFNRILISPVTLDGFVRGIAAFEEKPDLLPFEEAKLYGHNAVHALLGYLAHERGLVTMDQAAAHGDLMVAARRAFVDECGAALVRKHAGHDDVLFTPDGFAAYADDLLARMVNPFLNDRVQRVIRDPRRKLGWHDRLYGTMRLALTQGIQPIQMARGAAAAIRFLSGFAPRSKSALEEALAEMWGIEAEAPTAGRLVQLTWDALRENP